MTPATRRRIEPEPRRRIPLRTFADWNEPSPGGMEMDLVASATNALRGTPETAKMKLREIAAALDPLKLLEEMRAMQAHLTTLADGEIPPSVTAEPPDLAAFVAGLSSAWRAGEVRPTFSVAAKPRSYAACKVWFMRMSQRRLPLHQPGSLCPLRSQRNVRN